MGEAALAAKMFLVSKEDGFTGDGEKKSENVKLAAVAGGSDANKQWSKWTPSGNLQLSISNPDAFGKLTGGYYKILIVPCGEND